MYLFGCFLGAWDKPVAICVQVSTRLIKIEIEIPLSNSVGKVISCDFAKTFQGNQREGEG